MYCIIKYADRPALENLKSDDSQALSYTKLSFQPSVKFEHKELLINPNCYAQILLDFICEELKINKNADFDLCDTSGKLARITTLKPYNYATDVLKPKETYYVVFLERDINWQIQNVDPMLMKGTKLHSEINMKLKKSLQLSYRVSLDNCKKSKRMDKSSKVSIKSSSNSISSRSGKQIPSSGKIQDTRSKSSASSSPAL